MLLPALLVLFSSGIASVVEEPFFEQGVVRQAAEAGELAGHRLGRLQRGHRAILGIRIKENLQHLPALPFLGNFPVREQDFAQLATIKVETEGLFPENPE